MFEYNDKLKKLPIPELKASMDRYKELVKPLVTEEELANTRKIVDAFVKEGSHGFTLHKELVKKYAKKDNTSWLLDLWNKMYLEYRDEIAININYYAVLNNDAFKSKYSHAQILAIVINSVSKLYFSIIDESLPAEKKQDTALCMANYKNILGGTRIPEYNSDSFQNKKLSKNSNHIIFMYKGYMYKLMVSDEKGLLYSPGEIANSLQLIINENKDKDAAENIGLITSSRRDKTAFLYKKINHSIKNSRNFEEINQAIAVFCLDKKTKYSTDYTQSFLLSTGKNRFFDKSTQFILTDDKELGINNEHSHADASLYKLVLQEIYQALTANNINFAEKQSQIKFKKLEWETKSELKVQLNQVAKEHRKKATNKFTKACSFYDFGKDRIKQFRISPDAFFHIALQLAQFRTFRCLRTTYEAIDMRDYREGRTECTRPLNMESKIFAENYDTLLVNNDIIKLKELLAKAVNSHITNIKAIKQGGGVERYLFGLEEINKHYVDSPLAHKFFNDTAYKKLKEDFISTSNFGGDNIKAFGFANVHQDGYGIGYSVNKNHIAISICSDKSNKEHANKLIENLHQAFIDISSLYELT